MRIAKWYVFILLLSVETFSQSGFYTYLNKKPAQLIQEKGYPIETRTIAGNKVLFYRYENYLTSYMVRGNSIINIDMTSGWVSKKKAQNVAQFEAQLCRNDGFAVAKISTGYLAKNNLYTIEIKVYAADDGYEVSSTAELR